MPLRDHFRPPLAPDPHWAGFHALWPGTIVTHLSRVLPPRYYAEPRVYLGDAEVDIGGIDNEPGRPIHSAEGTNGAVATAVWAPARPTWRIETDLPIEDEFEVRVFDSHQSGRVVAAIELVSPSNKDRPDSRALFAAKCRALLRHGVSVAIIDPVTTRQFNLYAELLIRIGRPNPDLTPDPPSLYAAACRWLPKNGSGELDTWFHPLDVGQPLPTLPLWLTDDLAIPLDLDATYEETYRILRLP